MRDGALPMFAPSILFTRPEDRAAAEACNPPECFPDLNLDQVVNAVMADWSQYNLKPFCFSHLNDIADVVYRQDVFRDLEGQAMLALVRAFTTQMQVMRDHLLQSGKLYYQSQKDAWFLDAVDIYGDAIKALASDLAETSVASRGLTAMRDYIVSYTASPAFLSLAEETKRLKRDLASLEYWLLIRDSSFQISKPGAAPDYSADVEDTFRKFQQGATKAYAVKFTVLPNMDHIEAKVLEFVSELYPDVFAHLSDYCTRRRDYLDEVIAAFDRDVHFYIAFLNFIAKLRSLGHSFCYPRVVDTCKEIQAADAFDVALAWKLAATKTAVVCNDFRLNGPERIIVVTGPNQGGKTTFARMFGQLHYLASIGCPVPGRDAQLFLFDKLFTHFEKQERVETLRGKLQDDLMRVHDIMERSTSYSVVILNEIFTSTALEDAIYLSRQIMHTLVDLDLLAVWVTFVDELASCSEQTVSMASSVVAHDPASRTFKILRKPADGLSHAMSIAQKHGVTYQRLKERLRS
jgi:DNA mismatch repair protein MutS